MKICMLAYTFYEGDSRVMRYAETLAKRGDRVDIIALRKSGQAACGEVNGVNVYRVQERVANEAGRLSYLFRLLKFLLRSSALLTGRHLKERYDVIHVHSVPDFEVFAAWFPKLTGAKIILDIHDLVPEFYASKFETGNGTLLYRLLVFVEKASSFFSDHVIIANHLWEKTLRSRSVSRERSTVLINYPDPSVFFRRPAVRDGGKFTIIYPGTLNRHQGVDIAIRAFAKIKDSAPHAEFQIYGEGGAKKDLVKLACGLGLDGRVIFNDLLPLDEIAMVMASSDLGVVPKRDNSFGGEAFSTKILEFMALGIPVLVSGTRIDRFYFNDSLVKFFKPEDEDDMAESMLMLINDPGLRQRLAANSFEYINENTWEVKKLEYLNLVDGFSKKCRPKSIF